MPAIISYSKRYTDALKTLLTYPVSVCTAERSFSSLKRIKTPLRNTMTGQRLSSLPILRIHNDIDEVVIQFGRTIQRRLLSLFDCCGFLLLVLITVFDMLRTCRINVHRTNSMCLFTHNDKASHITFIIICTKYILKGKLIDTNPFR